MSQNKTTEFLKLFLIWFSIFYLGLFAFKSFSAKKDPSEKQTAIEVSPVDRTMTLGNLAQFKIKNNLDQKITLPSPCEKDDSLVVSRLINDKKFAVSDFKGCKKEDLPAIEVAPKSTAVLDLKTLNAQIFSEEGTYTLDLNFQTVDQPYAIASETIEYAEPGAFRRLFRFLISRPLFNTLVFFVEKMPNHSLGFSIIILTILVRCLLFLPNQKSMKSQRKLQKLQPKIEELKRKHGKNQQMLAMKTMELYKTEKINPMSSCLPMLAQMPVMLGIYFVVKDGVSEHLRHLLYSFNTDIDLSLVNPEFFTLNLEEPDKLVLPILVGAAQFLAIKLSFIANKKKQKKTTKKEPDSMAGQMEQMQKMMQYFLPVMLAFFTASFPAAVGVYWLTSTIFGIFQQKLVNYQLDKTPEVRRKTT